MGKKSHGIFINYKRSHKHLAGRIFDYFKNRGFAPFMDEESLHIANDFWNDIEQEIIKCPYFLCLLSADGVDDLIADDAEERYFFKEILTAIKNNKKILVVRCDGVNYDSLNDLPDIIKKFKGIHSIPFPNETNAFFYDLMRKLCDEIELSAIKDVINWQEYTSLNSNTLVEPRSILESKNASLENRFGHEFIDCIRNKREFQGEYRIKEINMACYAASLVVAPEKTMIDRHAYDYGMVFNIFAQLLNDPDFDLRLITTAPCLSAAKDAVKYAKLGNSALEKNPQAVFLGSYAKLFQLTKIEPYKSAIKDKRFDFMLTECSLPYAIFQIVYKDKWQIFNHVKIDLYSFGIDSSVNRRSMMFFEHEDSDKDNYSFFADQFIKLRDMSKTRSDSLIRNNHDKWIAQWEALIQND